MGIRAKQLSTGTFDATANGRAPFGAGLFDLTTATSVFAAGAIPGSKLASGGVGAAQLDAAVAGDGISGGGGTALAIDRKTGGGLKIDTAQLAVEPNDFAGTGVEDDGADNLRLATQGTGIAGGGGTTLSVDVTATLDYSSATHTHAPNSLQVVGTPDSANDAVNKTYIDNLLSGLTWRAAVHVKEMIGSDAALDIEGFTPAQGDAYVIDTANGAGVLVGATVGDIWEYSGVAWNLIVAGVGGFVAAGIRGLASIQTALNGTIGLVDATDDGKILEWDGTSLTPSKTTSLDGWAVLVTDQDGDGDSVFANNGYKFAGVVATGTWIQFTGAGQINAGAGLSKAGNTINTGDANKGVQVNASDLEIAAAEIASTGLEVGISTHLLRLAVQGNGIAGGAGSTLSVNPDSTTGGNTQPVAVAANGVGLDIAAIAGTGVEADGAANLRLAAPGSGLTGGAGSALAVQPDQTPTANVQPVAVETDGVGLDIAAIAGTGVEADGAANLRLAAQGNGINGGAGSTLSVKPDATTGGDTAPVAVAANGVGLDVTTLDGDHLDIDFTPASYTPDASPAEAADVNDLAAHLKGIDTALSTAGGTPRQEALTSQNITGTDTALTDTLANTPTAAAAVTVFLNGIIQSQGAGADYTVAGATITWLANTGTAVDMDTADVLTVVYES